MTEKSYFSSKKKEKFIELKHDLCSDKKDRRKEALKKIINDMTIGNDMSDLFPEVVKLLQTDNSETKKLVYLYLMSYARSHSDLAILAVNTFIKDCDDNNPLIRALAVRTMTCLSVSSITAHLCDSLRKCLKDSDPYVRKTAAISILKIYKNNENLIYEQNFLDNLIELLNDNNPTVLTNSISVLSEILLTNPESLNNFVFDFKLVNKLLTCINECTEWGQITILDFLSNYNFNSQNEALNIAERITSRLSHANSAVVLSTVKILIKIIIFIGEDESSSLKLLNKLSPPLISMLSLEPEIQYVALKNINLIIQRFPLILANDLPSFYVKYNDPLYIKVEKLEILIMLVDESNVDRVLTELKDYASEVDVEFVRKSVRAIGNCALKIDSAADKCVKILLDLIDTKISYVVQESIIVSRDIMRKYPKKYENIIQKIGDNLSSLDEPEAKAAFIWILGEYGERIVNSSEFLKLFTNNFLEENSVVQLQLLTACVKIFLKKPNENKNLVEEVLSIVTQKVENPDVKDRGLVYWRLLQEDSEIAKRVVLAVKPILNYKSKNLEISILNSLLPYISCLSSIYHRLPQSLVDSTVLVRSKSQEKEDLLLDKRTALLNLEDFPMFSPKSDNHSDKMNVPQEINLFDAFVTGNEKSGPKLSPLVDAGMFTSIYKPKEATILSKEAGNGLQIKGGFDCSGDCIFLNLNFVNFSSNILNNFNLQINSNYFGLVLNNFHFSDMISSHQSLSVKIPLTLTDKVSITFPINLIQFALSANDDMRYFYVNFPLHFFFCEPEMAKFEISEFMSSWKSIWPINKVDFGLQGNRTKGAIINKLKELKIYSQENSNQILGKCLLKNKSFGLVQIDVELNLTKITVGSSNQEIIQPLLNLIVQVFSE